MRAQFKTSNWHQNRIARRLFSYFLTKITSALRKMAWMNEMQHSLTNETWIYTLTVLKGGKVVRYSESLYPDKPTVSNMTMILLTMMNWWGGLEGCIDGDMVTIKSMMVMMMIMVMMVMMIMVMMMMMIMITSSQWPSSVQQSLSICIEQFKDHHQSQHFTFLVPTQTNYKLCISLGTYYMFRFYIYEYIYF